MQKHSRALWMTWHAKELPTKAAAAPIKHCTHPHPYSCSQIVSSALRGLTGLAESSKAEAPKVTVSEQPKKDSPPLSPLLWTSQGTPSLRRGHIFA